MAKLRGFRSPLNPRHGIKPTGVKRTPVRTHAMYGTAIKPHVPHPSPGSRPRRSK